MEDNVINLDSLRHSASHVLAQAVKNLYKDVKLAIGPATDTGFYYDFDTDYRFVPEDLPLIEEEMNKIIKEDYSITKKVITKKEALETFSKYGEIYKLELINELDDSEEISIYTQDGFFDLCKGPHIDSTGLIHNFKLLSIAGAYWRGSEKNKMLQRIYGTAFLSKNDLEEYIAFLLEVQKRDHRKLGKDLKIFIFDEKIGSGLPLWLPNGAILRNIIEQYEIEEHLKRDYQLLRTPHIGLSELWKISGHLSFYKDSMFSSIEVDNQEYILKPMNCPFHLRAYQNELHSYRELPIRYFELANVYRYEKSGVMHGLLRVRGFTQDDAHIFCSEDQIDEELISTLNFAKSMLKTFGFENYNIYLSFRDKNNFDKYVGIPEKWDIVENKLENIVKSINIPYQIDYDEAKFYGPAIDLKIKDALGREWQCSTIQVDFNLADRFDLKYIGNDGKEYRPYMLHRTLLGSLERFIGVLLEHYGGNLPLWLSPEQVRIIPITENNFDYSIRIKKVLNEINIRTTIDFQNERLNAKIRKAETEKIPYIFVAGKKEEENNTISIRKRHGIDIGTKNIDEMINILQEDIKEKI